MCACSGCALIAEGDQYLLQEQVLMGDYESGYRFANEMANDQDNDPLWWLESASLSLLMQEPQRMMAELGKAEAIGRDKDSESLASNLSEQILKTIFDGSAGDYETNPFEETMLNTYRALGYWAMGDLAATRVEFNRVNERQRRSVEYYEYLISEQQKNVESRDADEKKAIQEILSQSQNQSMRAYSGYVNPFSDFLYGLFFYLHGQDENDQRKAMASFERVAQIIGQPLKLSTQNAHTNSEPRVWVIIESGQIARLWSQRADFPVQTEQGIVFTGISFPEVSPPLNPMPSYRIHHDSRSVQAMMVTDMDSILYAHNEAVLPMIVTRSVISAIAKTIAQNELAEEAGNTGFLLGNLYQLLTNVADTRQWSMLPRAFFVAQIPASAEPLVIEQNGYAFAEINVPPNRNSVVFVKRMYPTAEPIIYFLK